VDADARAGPETAIQRGQPRADGTPLDAATCHRLTTQSTPLVLGRRRKVVEVSASAQDREQSGRSMRPSSTVVPVVGWRPSTQNEHDEQQDVDTEHNEGRAKQVLPDGHGARILSRFAAISKSAVDSRGTSNETHDAPLASAEARLSSVRVGFGL